MIDILKMLNQSCIYEIATLGCDILSFLYIAVFVTFILKVIMEMCVTTYYCLLLNHGILLEIMTYVHLLIQLKNI